MPNKPWWKQAVIYQIYPRSFQDTTGTGVGDLRGIIQRLDYIMRLGVTAIWLNPVYPSPNDDNGYDVSDYRGIMPEFGTMADFDELMVGMRERGLRLIMDLVVNHSSDEHRWFRESRKSRDNPYRDYYHWWPAEKGTPPARFSYFDPSGAWTYDEITDAYYLHYFSRKQPDLNWQNPKVREEVYDIMRFWLDKGVDGFRLDAFQFVGKDTSWPDLGHIDAANMVEKCGLSPIVHDYLREMHEVVAPYEAMLVAEGAGRTMQDAIDLSDPARKELDMVYHFEIADYGTNINGFDLVGLKRLYEKWAHGLYGQGWDSIYLGNHDVPRMVSKYGDDRPEFRELSAKALNTLLLTMPGTTYCYQGDEIGMTNINFTRIEQYRDLQAINNYQAAKEKGEDLNAYMNYLAKFSRDHARTPVQWNGEEQAGFTSGQPWLAVNPNYTAINVAEQEGDVRSVLNHFRQLTTLRKEQPTLIYGDFKLLVPDHQQAFVYLRTSGEGDVCMVAMNWSDQTIYVQDIQIVNNAQPLINNYSKPVLKSGSALRLYPWQAVVFSI